LRHLEQGLDPAQAGYNMSAERIRERNSVLSDEKVQAREKNIAKFIPLGSSDKVMLSRHLEELRKTLQSQAIATPFENWSTLFPSQAKQQEAMKAS